MQKIKQIFDFLEISDNLKRTKRWLGVKQMRKKESSASHSWSLAIFCYIVSREFNFKIDIFKSLKIALVHDIVESIAGDIASLLILKGKKSADSKHKKELDAINKIGKILPNYSSKEIVSLWFEYENSETREAKFVKAMDKLESQVHMLCVGENCFHDPSIMGEYTKKAVLDFPELLALNQFIQEKKEAAFGKLGWEWKREYNISPNGRKEEIKKFVKIFNFMKIAYKLKNTKRWLNTKEMVKKESSADHSWNLSLFALVTTMEFDFKIDNFHAIKIAMTHDLVEALAGDTDHSLIAFGLKTEKQKYDAEVKAITIIKKTLPKKTGQEISDLWHEYEKSKTNESKFAKALDKIETINHMAVLGSSCFDHPELIAPYPNKAVKNYPLLIPFLQELHSRLKPQFAEKSWEWDNNYDISTSG